MHALGPGDLSASSRRTFLHRLATTSGLLSLSCIHANGAERGLLVPSAATQYSDVATDFPVLRLTDTASNSFLPPFNASALSRHGDFLIYSSDASGSLQVYRADFKRPASKKETARIEVRQWTDAAALNPAGLTLLPGDRSFLYADDRAIYSAAFTAIKPAEVYKLPDEFELGRGISITTDGSYAALVERRISGAGSRTRLRLLNLRMRTSTVLTESDDEIADPMVRPKRASVMYRRGGGIFLANFDGKQAYRLKLAEGTARSAVWSPDGRSVLYLNVPSDPARLVNIREFVPDTNQDKAVADTTQFAAFNRNADASVFAGSSGSKASPYVLLLVRAVKRELTLCEHRASDPAMVAPLFSPNSQQVFFASDMHGKPAIYRVDVAKLVAETRDDARDTLGPQ